jgi:dTDP-4-dehydrorhamnose 3,5-epimerase-like enzyme
MSHKLILGSCFSDFRGKLFYNNDFDLSIVKRIYIIENSSMGFIRSWQGHKIEQRWFCSVQGSFIIRLIKIDNWQIPSISLPIKEYHLNADNLDVLHIPAGFVTSIQANENSSKLLVMSDYTLGEIIDDYRFPSEYFNK